MFSKDSLNESPSSITVAEFEQVANLRFSQLDWSNGLDKCWPLCEMVDQCVCCKCQYDLCCSQSFKDTFNKNHRNSVETALVQEKNRAASYGLSTVNVCNDLISHIFEWSIVDSNFFAVDRVSAFIKNFPKVVSVVAFYVYKVHFAIEPQRFITLLIQPLFSGPGLFKHYERGTRHNIATTIAKRTASGKAIDEIECELVADWTHAQRVEVGTKIST